MSFGKTRGWWEDRFKGYGLIDSKPYKAHVDWFYYIDCMFILYPKWG